MSSEPTQPERVPAGATRRVGRPTRLGLAIRVVAVLSVLGVHVWERAKDAHAIPYSERHLYPGDYAISLAIMLGRGFDGLRVDDPSAGPLREFLSMRSPRLEREDLAEYDRVDRSIPGRFAHRPRDQISRAIDLYVAAGLWSVFGIDWRVYTAFYVGVSTLCGLAIFFTVRRLSGSFGCGLAAAILFALSPYEARFMIYSVRDVSPLWFTIIAYWAVTCVADRFRTPWANGASYVATGVATTIGLGWRPDVAMLVPVIAVTLVAVMLWQRRRWWMIAAAVLLFAVGAKAPMVVIDQLLKDDSPSSGPFGVLHVAYYGDATRSNILEEENSFQTMRHDDFVFTLAGEWREQLPAGVREPWDTFGPAYGRLVLRLYREMAEYHLWDWATALPQVGFRSLALAASPDGKRFARWLPHLALAGGLLGVLLYRRYAPVVLSILVFVLYYGAIFLAVLPEGKHLAPFVFPVIVLGALGLWLPFAYVDGRKRDPDAGIVTPGRRQVAATAVAISLAVAAALFAAHRFSYAKRQGYLDAVRGAAASATDAGAAIADPRVFAQRVEFAPDAHEGYLLDIVAGAHAGDLVLRNRPDDGGPAPTAETRHRLVPGVSQQFFFSCYRGWRRMGHRFADYTVRLSGDASIVAARRLDLSTWDRLPFATVFTDDDPHAGSPPLAHGPATRLIHGDEGWDAWGLRLAEAWVTGLRPPSTVLSDRDDPAYRVAPFDGAAARADADGTWIDAPPAPDRYAAQFNPFTAPRRGRYVFALDTRVREGDFAFGLLSGDQTRWMALAGALGDAHREGEIRLVVCDLEAGESVVPTISNPSRAIESSYLVRDLEIAILHHERETTP